MSKKDRNTTDAKLEFLAHLKDSATGRVIKCSSIEFGERTFNLHINYTPYQYRKFLRELDYMYDSGYGGQMLFGTIWYTDGTWSSRGEYDGSEWWEFNEVPEIPKELQ